MKKILAAALVSMTLAFGLLAFLASESEGKPIQIGNPREAKVVDWTKEKVVTVIGEVNAGILEKAREVEAQAGKPIRIFINSPGGSVMAGNVFIQAMETAKTRGSKIECAVSNLAASMGIHILAHCDTRYILPGGYLLFHEPRVGAPNAISPSEALATYVGLKMATDSLDVYLKAQLKVSDEFYNFNNIAQTLWSAESFNANIPGFNLKIVRDILLPPELKISIFDPIGSPLFEIPLADTTANPITYPGPILN